MDKKMILAVAGAGKTYTICQMINKFIYNYIIKPYECLILKNYNVPQIRTEGVDVKTEPAENFSNGKKDFKYYKKIIYFTILIKQIINIIAKEYQN